MGEIGRDWERDCLEGSSGVCVCACVCVLVFWCSCSAVLIVTGKNSSRSQRVLALSL
jgi:hypothetical protein